jgi:hypothetical protein
MRSAFALGGYGATGKELLSDAAARAPAIAGLGDSPAVDFQALELSSRYGVKTVKTVEIVKSGVHGKKLMV